jgi:D-glycero-D-manno-heptose 1,7-bisphosphate phosphatase
MAQVVILAGGLGTRLGPLAEGLPKSMIPLAGRPFLEHVLRQVAGQGFDEALLLVGFRAERIEAHFGDGSVWGTRIRYSREPVPLGTGGAVKLAGPLLESRFVLLYGDVYRDFDYSEFLRRRAGNCLAAYPYEPGLTTVSRANIGLTADGRKVDRYSKAGAERGLTHVDAGFGVFDREVLEILPEGASSFEDLVYPTLAARGALDAELVGLEFHDIGNPVDLAATRALFRPRT